MQLSIEDILNLGRPELGSVFDDMILAESEIQRAMDATEDQEIKRLIWESFIILRRPVLLFGKSSEFYRAHIRELLQRIQRIAESPTNTDTLEKPTNAEVAAAIIGASELAPLKPKATAVAVKSFLAAAEIGSTVKDEIAKLAKSFPSTDFYEEEVIEAVEKVLQKNDPELYARRAQFTKKARKLKGSKSSATTAGSARASSGC